MSNGVVSFTKYNDLANGEKGGYYTFGDWNGDGLVDVLRQRAEIGDTEPPYPSGDVEWFINNGVANGVPSFTPYAHRPGGGPRPHPLPITDDKLNRRTLTFADVNGDGLPDLLAPPFISPGGNANSWGSDRWFINNGMSNGVVSFTEYNDLLNGEKGGYYTFGDWNGDGLVDVLRQRAEVGDTEPPYPSGDVEWFINNGVANGVPSFTLYAARFGAPHPLPITDDKLNRRTLTFADVNGDGLADLVASSSGAVDRWFINSGMSNGVVSFTQYDNLLPISPITGGYPIIGDWSGDGLPDVLFQKAASVQNRYWFVNNSTHPDLVTKFRSGVGATTSITYKPLNGTGIYTKDSGTNAAVAPMLDLAASHWVVSHVDQSDGIGGQRGWDYSYAGAKVDQQGRGFLGFRQRTVKDLRTGIASTSTHRQDFPFAGLASSETTTLGPLTLSAITNAYGAANLGGTRRRAFLSQSVATRTDLDGTAFPSVTTNYQYDTFGNATEVTAATSDGFSRTTTNSYSNDEINWLLGRLTRATAVNQAP